jgi:hypothetical protein
VLPQQPIPDGENGATPFIILPGSRVIPGARVIRAGQPGWKKVLRAALFTLNENAPLGRTDHGMSSLSRNAPLLISNTVAVPDICLMSLPCFLTVAVYGKWAVRKRE